MNRSTSSQKVGKFLFKFRSFTPIPLIVLVVFFFKPQPWRSDKILILAVAVSVTLLGQLIRCLAVGFAGSGTSGRESYFRAESLNINGLYSIVRNPLYIGNILIYNGLLILYGNWLAALLFNIFLIGQYHLIIAAEENYLRELYGTIYNQYLQRVNRFIPRFKKYRKSEASFNLRKVIFKENDSFFNWLLMAVLISFYKDVKVSKPEGRNFLFYILSGAILVVGYGCIKWLKKKNRSDRQHGGE